MGNVGSCFHEKGVLGGSRCCTLVEVHRDITIENSRHNVHLFTVGVKFGKEAAIGLTLEGKGAVGSEDDAVGTYVTRILKVSHVDYLCTFRSYAAYCILLGKSGGAQQGTQGKDEGFFHVVLCYL